MIGSGSASRLLLVVAAPAEARAVLAGVHADPALADCPWTLHPAASGVDVVVCGISKSNAAGATGRFLDPMRHRGVISVGVAGALPTGGGQWGAGLLATVLATASVFVDEGLQTSEGFADCAAMGFPLGPPPVAGSLIPGDERLLAELRPLAEVEGRVATVSTCSGTDTLARGVRERTGAAAEAMEGAAVSLVAARVGVPAAEVRVISNTTGDRAGQRWDLRGALDRLRVLAGAIAGA